MSTALKNMARENRVRKNNPASNQMVRTPGRTDEVKNNAGGFVFKAGDKLRLERFLILGTDGGTFYVNEKALTKQNLDFVKSLIKTDYRLVVDTLIEVAVGNRAAKNSPSLYTLALLVSEPEGDKVYLRATGAFDKVVRTSTHLFEFANYVDSLGGWGRGKRNLIAEWYTGKTADQLAYQAVKYRQREGWTHRDLFRKVHPVGVDKTVGNFILGRPLDAHGDYEDRPPILGGFEAMQRATSAKDVIRVLGTYRNLPWETIPTQFLTDPEVWKVLFYNGALGQTALLRNVTRFAKNGALSDLVFAGDVAQALADTERIVKGRVHPVAYANALGIYRNGQVTRYSYYGDRAAKDWTVNAKVAGGLEAGFYNSFQAIEPAGKRTMVSVDVSGSMTWGAPAGLVGMTYMDAAAVMAMVTVRTEPYAMVTAFSTRLTPVDISDVDSLDTVMKKFHNIGMGGTDVAQPMVYAKTNRVDIDTFAVYSDLETWAGTQKVHEALTAYRKARNSQARLAVIGLASTSTTVADPKDTGSLNLVGFDSAAPRVLADFSAGRI